MEMFSQGVEWLHCWFELGSPDWQRVGWGWRDHREERLGSSPYDRSEVASLSGVTPRAFGLMAKEIKDVTHQG